MATMTPGQLAQVHMQTQVRDAAAVQAGLHVAFKTQLDPSRLDETFPTYLKSALALVSVGRNKAAATATSYYGAAKTAAGYEGALENLPVPDMNIAKVAQDFLVNGPVSIKAHLADGQALEAALRMAEAKTLAVGKRHVLNGGRDTIIRLSRKDKDARGWARVSDGRPCHFCAMLVSRGPVYKEGTAHFKAHNGCGCSVRPYFAGESDGGWSPEAAALDKLWRDKGGDIASFRSAYSEALADPDSAVFKTITDRVAGQIAAPAISSARRAAEAAFARTGPLSQAAEVATKPAFVSAVEKAAAQLPADRSKIGILEENLTGRAALKAAQDDVLRKAGGKSLEDLRIKEIVARQNQDSLEKIRAYYEDHALTTKWPPELSYHAKKLGFGRRQPKTIMANWSELDIQLSKLHDDAWSAHSTTEWKLRKLESNPPAGGLRRLDDLAADGKLGAQSQKSLDAILSAGKAVDGELQRRMAKLMPGPDLAAAHQALGREIRSVQDEYKALVAKRVQAVDHDVKVNSLLARERELWPKYRETQETALAYSRKRTVLERETTLDLLKQVRPIGGGARPAYVKGAAKMGQSTLDAMDNAHSMYPTDWNDHVTKAFPRVELGEVQRGYNQGGQKIMLSRDNNSPGSGPLGHVSIHELGHSMEGSVPGLKGSEWAFHYARSDKIVQDGITKLAPSQSIYGKDIGMGQELHVPDTWPEKYTGKSYKDLRGGLGADSSWEVFTTGVESLLEGSPYFKYPGAAGTTDAEFRQFILGALSVL